MSWRVARVLRGGFVNGDADGSGERDGVIGRLRGRTAKQRIVVRIQVIGEAEWLVYGTVAPAI